MSQSILLVGAGAVGASIASWVAPKVKNFYVFDRGESLEALKTQGILSYPQGKADNPERVEVKAISSLKSIPAPDYVLVCVKNYSLDGVCKSLQAAYGDHPVVVGLQNGMENQAVLPRYFSKVIYGILCYNAWLDGPAHVGYQKRGPLVLGTLNQSCDPELVESLCSTLNLGMETSITQTTQDAIVSKMIINLTNSLTTLIGFGFIPLEDEARFQKLLTGLTYEGVQIARAAGFKESRLGGMPGWGTIRFAAKAPLFITRPIFKKNMRKMVISSMAQDILQNKRTDNELQSINGCLLALADEHRVDAPLNRRLYQLCLASFNEGFKPLPLETVWQKVMEAH